MGLFDSILNLGKKKQQGTEGDDLNLDIGTPDFSTTTSPQQNMSFAFNEPNTPQLSQQPYQSPEFLSNQQSQFSFQPMTQQQPPQQTTFDQFTSPSSQGYQTPTYDQQYSQSYTQSTYDWESYIHEIAEKVVEERLRDVDQKISELNIVKEKLELEIQKIKEDLNRLSNRVDNLYDTIAQKIEQYDKGLSEATTEVQALHRLIRTMVPAISQSVKELKETIDEIKALRESIKP